MLEELKSQIAILSGLVDKAIEKINTTPTTQPEDLSEVIASVKTLNEKLQSVLPQ